MNKILDLFSAITLDKMDNVKLMNRQDIKYAFHKNKLAGLLNEVTEDYFVLEVLGGRSMEYESVYYDTPDFHFYTSHHNGKLNRLKVRMRRYVKSDDCYLEIKFKTNKYKTIKKRRKIQSLTTPLETDTINYLKKLSGYNYNDLENKLLTTYTRTTLVSKTKRERVTIDTNLAYTRNGITKEFPFLAIAEIKQEKVDSSPFRDLMKKAQLQPGGISKYCFGIISMYDNVKKNNFKEKISLINKIKSETLIGNEY